MVRTHRLSCISVESSIHQLFHSVKRFGGKISAQPHTLIMHAFYCLLRHWHIPKCIEYILNIKMDFVASDFFLSPRCIFPLSFPFLFIRFSLLAFFFFLFLFTIYPSASLELPPFILPLDYLSICYTTTPRWFVEVSSVINYFYVSLAINMIKILRNLHLNDV